MHFQVVILLTFVLKYYHYDVLNLCDCPAGRLDGTFVLLCVDYTKLFIPCLVHYSQCEVKISPFISFVVKMHYLYTVSAADVVMVTSCWY